MLEFDVNCVIPETGILYFFIGRDDKGALLYFPSDDVSDLVRTLPDDTRMLQNYKSQFWDHCGIIERKNFTGVEESFKHEVRVTEELELLTTHDLDELNIEDLDFDNPEELTYSFSSISWGRYCMKEGGIVTNPKFVKKPFSISVLHSLSE